MINFTFDPASIILKPIAIYIIADLIGVSFWMLLLAFILCTISTPIKWSK